jgi:RNA polymerase sigma-70 factor (ECF subfamily)
MKKAEHNFSRLIEENKDKIYRICCYYLSNDEDRKDLYQETLLNLWKAFKSFREESAFSTWAFRITVNTALQFISKEKRIDICRNNYSNQGINQGISHEDRNITPEQSEIDLLHKSILQLPLLDMIIISLVLEEVPSKDIAKIIGLTDTNVRVRIHRAKSTLKSIIEGGKP